ncbi:PA14 domain-containing protein [Bacillus thuringiensis]
MAEMKGLPKNGLLAYYFESPYFQNLLFFSKGTYTDTQVKVDPKFISPDQKVRAVRWLGRIQPEQTDDYAFSTSDDAYVVLQIQDIQDKYIVINRDEYNTVTLTKDQLYTMRLEYVLPSPKPVEEIQLSLQWWYAKGGQNIPKNKMYVPDFEIGTGITNLSNHLFDGGESHDEQKKREL